MIRPGTVRCLKPLTECARRHAKIAAIVKLQHGVPRGQAPRGGVVRVAGDPGAGGAQVVHGQPAAEGETSHARPSCAASKQVARQQARRSFPAQQPACGAAPTFIVLTRCGLSVGAQQ